jgi:hypothetical protein
VVHVRVGADVIGASRLGTVAAWKGEFEAGADERAVSWIFRAHVFYTIDCTEIIPEGVVRWLEIVLDLDNAGRSDLVVRLITHLECHASTQYLGVDHGVDYRTGVPRNEDGFVVIPISLKVKCQYIVCLVRRVR